MEINNALKDRIKQLEQTIKEHQVERITLEEVLDEKDEKIRALEKELNAKNDKIKVLEEMSPVKCFGKVHQGRRGATSWPHYVWELILEQLVNGTPPTSINANIVAIIQSACPTTTIRELPSIWTI
jgi:uncharacterized protein YhaN